MKKKCNNFVLVLVLYNQKVWDCNTYHTLVRSNSELPLFIYDNSPEPQHKPVEFAENVKYVSDTSNPGLSYAYNRAADYAKEKDYTWMLILDQDTFFAPNIIDEYVHAIDQNPTIKLFAPPMMLVVSEKYMSPVKIRCHSARPSKSVPVGVVSLKTYSPINSGMMINLEAFWEAGGYNERVKLDFSDYQFVKRFSKKQDSFYVLSSACRQEYSNEVQGKEQKLHRYALFCDSLKACDKVCTSDKAGDFYVVFKRMCSLILKTKSLKPVSIFTRKYL